MAELQAELQRLSGTTLDAQGAANVWAGTSGLDLVGALNVKAGTTGLELLGVLNRVVGTTGVGANAVLAGRSNIIRFPGTSGNYASSPDSAALSVTGDIDLRVEAALASWTPAAVNNLLAKWVATGNQRSYRLQVNTTGNLVLSTSPDGTTIVSVASTAPVGFGAGSANWVRGTRASGSGTVTFYTSSDGVVWTPLGTTVATTAGGVFDSTAVVEIGSQDVGTANLLTGTVYYAEVRNGIGGAVVGVFDPTTQVVSGVRTPSSWTGSAGNVWTVNGTGWSWTVG